MDYDDYPVEPRSDEQLDTIAEAILGRLGLAANGTFSALELLRVLQEKERVEIIVRPDIEMGRKEAFAASNPSRIFFRASTYEAVVLDEPRARMTVAHEVFHYFTHPGAPKARMTAGNLTPEFIPPHKSAERQARVGAAALLMPRKALAEVSSVSELMAKCRVSNQAAEIRFTQWQRNTKPKSELPFVRDHINYLRSLDLAASAPQPRSLQVQALWETLPTIEGEDGNQFRKCSSGSYRIARSQFGQMTECGWFIRDKRAVAWLAVAP